MNRIENSIEQVVDNILQDYSQGRDIDRIEPFRHPDKDVITDVIRKLAEEGLIRRIAVPFAADRFDKTLTPHGHAVCPACGDVSDLPEHVSETLKLALGECISYELTVRRECEECKKIKKYTV